VKNKEGGIVGMVTATILTGKLIKKKVTISDSLERVVLKEYRNVSSTTNIAELGRIFQRHQFVFVDNMYIASSFDLLNFMSEKNN